MMAAVLIVDDDDATRESLAEALEIAGFEVLAASRGEDALRLAVRERPSAAVVDFRMPGLSGVEVINRMLATPGLQTLCTILATAWPEVPRDLDGSTLLIQKPFSMERLLELLAQCGVTAPQAQAT
jgi:two-component system NtrC family response regulator